MYIDSDYIDDLPVSGLLSRQRRQGGSRQHNPAFQRFVTTGRRGFTLFRAVLGQAEVAAQGYYAFPGGPGGRCEEAGRAHSKVHTQIEG